MILAFRAVTSDPRLTRVGSFLRRTSIDELPLLFNVLKGDMSLVGPRAPFPLEVGHYSDKQRRRLEVRPGVTGYWQVFGRRMNMFDFDEMIQMDLEYVEKQSLLLDLKILLHTVVTVFTSSGAY